MYTFNLLIQGANASVTDVCVDIGIWQISQTVTQNERRFVASSLFSCCFSWWIHCGWDKRSALGHLSGRHAPDNTDYEHTNYDKTFQEMCYWSVFINLDITVWSKSGNYYWWNCFFTRKNMKEWCMSLLHGDQWECYDSHSLNSEFILRDHASIQHHTGDCVCSFCLELHWKSRTPLTKYETNSDKRPISLLHSSIKHGAEWPKAEF